MPFKVLLLLTSALLVWTGAQFNMLFPVLLGTGYLLAGLILVRLDINKKKAYGPVYRKGMDWSAFNQERIDWLKTVKH